MVDSIDHYGNRRQRVGVTPTRCGATCSIKDSHGRERRLWLVATTPLSQHGWIVARGRAHALEVLAIDRS